MTEEEKQAKIAELKKVPKPVQTAAMVAFALALITLVRIPVGAYAADLSVGKALLAGVVMSFWLLICGGSLYTRSRLGYVGLVFFSLLPLLGLIGFSLQLFQMMLEGTLSASWPQTIHCAIAVVQIVVTVALFWYLLAKRVRYFVWKRQV